MVAFEVLWWYLQYNPNSRVASSWTIVDCVYIMRLKWWEDGQSDYKQHRWYNGGLVQVLHGYQKQSMWACNKAYENLHQY
jgi:hypothetical protein